MRLGKFSVKKETLAIIVLITIVSVLNGAAGAQIIWALARKYIEEKRKKKAWLERKFGYDTMRVILTRLQKDGLVERKSWGFWRATEKGKNLVAGLAKKELSKKQKKEADVIIIFDIPEKERKKRDHLRLELTNLGFNQLQKSVWMGGELLPEAFIEYLRQLQLFNKVHIFSVKNSGTIHI